MAGVPHAFPRLQSVECKLPPVAVQDGTKGRILETALRLFAQYGFYGTSIRDIAAECGFQPAAFYAHYPSKEHVLAELVRVGHEVHQRALRGALLESDGTPIDQLRHFVAAHVRFHTEYSMLAIVANAEMHVLSQQLVSPSLLLRKQSEELLSDIIQRGIDRGDFRPPHAWLAVAAIAGMGLRVAHWYGPEVDISADEIANTYAELAVRMMFEPGRRKRS